MILSDAGFVHARVPDTYPKKALHDNGTACAKAPALKAALRALQSLLLRCAFVSVQLQTTWEQEGTSKNMTGHLRLGHDSVWSAEDWEDLGPNVVIQ